MQTQMRTHPAEALIAFIHACWHSPFAVSFMKHSVDKLVRCIELLENNITSDQLQAAQCRVLG